MNNSVIKLLPPKLLKRFIEVGKQDIPNPIILARYYQPMIGIEWYATEFDIDTQFFTGFYTPKSDKLIFGIDELEDLVIDGNPVWLDLNWKECRLSEIK